MKTYRSWILRIVCLFLFFVIFLFGMEHTSKSTTAQDQQRLLEAIKKAAVTCYSVEGFYPYDLSYLIENYGVYIDERHYQVHYEYSGSNLIPDIRVFEKGDKK